MKAPLSGGPVDGEISDVGDRPPDQVDVEVASEEPPWRPIQPGEQFPEEQFEKHRYVLSNVNGDPDASEPRAKYSYLHKLPEE